MNLTETPEIVEWPKTHYLYVEKIGPFHQTAQAAWQLLHQLVPKLSSETQITSFMSLYKMNPEMIYRAGVITASKPAEIPEGFQYVLFPGGKYSRFVLKGSYANLPEASGRVHETAQRLQLQQREDFFIEHYVNDPKKTKEEHLITEILLPMR
jgi:AraC family transcriptional regulator